MTYARWTATRKISANLSADAMRKPAFQIAKRNAIQTNIVKKEKQMIREKNEKQFDESQYGILLKCSDRGDLTEWNEWRENNQIVSILLEGDNLAGANLTNVNLAGADLWHANLKGAKFIAAIVDTQTFIWGCDFDKQTVLTGEGLYSAKIEPRLKESLKIKFVFNSS